MAALLAVKGISRGLVRACYVRRGYLASLALPLAGATFASTLHYEGTAFSVPGGQPVYREEHWVREQEGVVHRLVLYRCMDGRPFARKAVKGAAGTAAPDFELIDGRDGYREGVRTREGRREVFVQERSGSPERSALLPDYSEAVIDAGFDTYARSRWNDLGEGRQVPVSFLIPSRLKYASLTLAGQGTVQLAGEELRRLRLKVDAWYGFAAPSLELTYTADRRLLRFEGISNVRDAAGKNRKVRIEFPSAPNNAAMNESAAAALPLAANCSS